MRLLFLLSLAAAPLLSARSLSAQVTPTSTEQMLSPGDSVRIVVWRHPEFSGDFVVAPDGGITHPLFRDIKVVGVSLATAEANVRAYLTKYETDPQFVMEPLLRIAVSGEVPRPLVFATQPGTTVAQAIARSGGTTQSGNRTKIRVIRADRNGPQRVFIANLEDPSDRFSMSPVRSGDQIIVDRRKSFLREVLMPVLGVVGSLASLGLLIDRVSRQN